MASGGWALYSEPNFQGKLVLQLPTDCLSNDPVVAGEPGYKEISH